METQNSVENLIILGSGCAGLTAAIYAARSSLMPLVLEGNMPGGLITTTTTVENFPGFPEGVEGYDLTARMRAQAEKFGAHYQNDIIKSVDFSSPVKKLIGENGRTYQTRALIIATGASPRLSGVKGEMEFYARGVHTCATCDGAFYRGKEVLVVGGGDSACEDAHFLTHFASRVTMVHRRDTLRASKIMAERVLHHPKIDFAWETALDEILGEPSGKVNAVRLKNLKTGALTERKTDGVFIAIGHVPQTAFLGGALPMDEGGYLLPSGSMVLTPVSGVFIAGDCTDRTYRQAITASGMGCMAAIEALRYLEA